MIAEWIFVVNFGAKNRSVCQEGSHEAIESDISEFHEPPQRASHHHGCRAD